MLRLIVAMPEDGLRGARSKWDELSAGAWSDHIEICTLGSDKAANDNLVISLAGSPNALIYVSQHLTSASVAQFNIKRFRKHELIKQIEDWLDGKNLNWRTRSRRECAKTPYQSIPPDEWVSQFAKVDPILGRRAGAALLAQFRIANAADLASYFDDLPAVDQNAFFLGADPHSGDMSMVNVLSANIDNNVLHDSRRLPVMKKQHQVRLFGDGSWSGGETLRRVHCLYKACDKKSNALHSSQRLDVRLGFMTDAAEKRIARDLEKLVHKKVVAEGAVRVTCPDGNRFSLLGAKSGQKGLAFQNLALLRYVDTDEKALRKLCKGIGDQIQPDKPLGTNEIASCIGFWYSLPAAMLPLFIIDGGDVMGADGVVFKWRALLRSKHTTTGIMDDPSHHCASCPLADRSAAVQPTDAAGSTVTIEVGD